MSEYGYEVKGNPDEGVVSVLIKVGTLTDAKGEFITEEFESRLFYPGNVIPEEDIATHTVEKYAAGDEHTLATFNRIKTSEDEAPAKAKPEPKPKVVAKKESDKSQSVE